MYGAETRTPASVRPRVPPLPVQLAAPALCAHVGKPAENCRATATAGGKPLVLFLDPPASPSPAPRDHGSRRAEPGALGVSVDSALTRKEGGVGPRHAPGADATRAHPEC